MSVDYEIVEAIEAELEEESEAVASAPMKTIGHTTALHVAIKLAEENGGSTNELPMMKNVQDRAVKTPLKAKRPKKGYFFTKLSFFHVNICFKE